MCGMLELYRCTACQSLGHIHLGAPCWLEALCTLIHRADQQWNMLQAEAAYAKQVLADTDKLQEDLYKELRGRIQEADQTVPLRYAAAWLLELCRGEMPPNGLQFAKTMLCN